MRSFHVLDGAFAEHEGDFGERGRDDMEPIASVITGSQEKISDLRDLGGG